VAKRTNLQGQPRDERGRLLPRDPGADQVGGEIAADPLAGEGDELIDILPDDHPAAPTTYPSSAREQALTDQLAYRVAHLEAIIEEAGRWAYQLSQLIQTRDLRRWDLVELIAAKLLALRSEAGR